MKANGQAPLHAASLKLHGLSRRQAETLIQIGLQTVIERAMATVVAAPAPAARPRTRRPVSAAARAKLAASMKRRWRAAKREGRNLTDRKA